ncbi:MAG: hypothetical protein WKF60_08185, partial [Ilumatobacter sp.]
MSSARRPPVDPIVVLTVAALIPALLLWGTWRWSSNRADIADDAVPPTSSAADDDPTAPDTSDSPDPIDPSVTDDPNEPPSVALATGLLSFRRSAAELSRDLNLVAWARPPPPHRAAGTHPSGAARG